jgi:hypothetical protein
MYDVSDRYLDAFKAPARHITGKVECETESGTITMAPNGSLVNFIIEKTAPKGKLFGFAVSQKITIEAIGILDSIKRGDKLVPSIESLDYTDDVVLMPHFYVDTVEFNKVKNRTIINGFDILHKLDSIPISNFEFTYPVYALNYALDILEPIGGYVEFDGAINQLIREPANLEGTETTRSVLAALAEFTGSICYVSQEDTVKFRGMGGSDFTDVITADDYFDLTIGEVITLTKIASATELNDNYVAGEDGYTQVMWENPFLNANSEVSTLIVPIANKVRNTQCTGYVLTWRGCPAYEMGDFIILQEKDGTAQYTRYFNEQIVYNGGLRVSSSWEPIESEAVEAAPQSLGEALKQVYAKVDKVNKEISLVVKEEDLEALRQEVSLKVSQDDVKILVEEAMGEGVDSVTTSTGFTFDEEGLTITKSGSDITTTITEDGMYIKRGYEEVLTADNEGVKAEDLHATTYLIIGVNSRFEDYDQKQRTGCFWIGRK